MSLVNTRSSQVLFIFSRCNSFSSFPSPSCRRPSFQSTHRRRPAALRTKTRYLHTSGRRRGGGECGLADLLTGQIRGSKPSIGAEYSRSGGMQQAGGTLRGGWGGAHVDWFIWAKVRHIDGSHPMTSYYRSGLSMVTSWHSKGRRNTICCFLFFIISYSCFQDQNPEEFPSWTKGKRPNPQEQVAHSLLVLS